MNINIQINDKEKGGATVTASHTPDASDAQDSGASKAGSSSGSVASADVLDIGTPPAWLADAMKKEATTASSDAPAATGNETDGGTAPSFN